MAFTVQLEDEDGQVVARMPGQVYLNFLTTRRTAAWSPDGERVYQALHAEYSWLMTIDDYSDTSFNSLQMQYVIAELKHLRTVDPASGPEVDQLLDLAERCEQGKTLHLRFYGDQAPAGGPEFQ